MDCLDKILVYYENKETHRSRAIKAWINNILVDLMGDLEEDNRRII